MRGLPAVRMRILCGRRVRTDGRSHRSPPAHPVPKPHHRIRLGPVTTHDSAGGTPPASPDRRTIRRWQRYLANERLEERVYRNLAERRKGEDREILLSLAAAESRHQEHWITLLGEHAEKRRSADLLTRCLEIGRAHV